MGNDQDKKRRKAIAYILRRRKRGRKVGANSGEVVKSWAEYSEVNFTPAGSYTPWWRCLLLIFVPIIILTPAIIIGGSQNAFKLSDTDVHPIAWALIALLGLLLLVLSAFTIAYIALTIWRFVRSLLPQRNE